MNETVLSKSVSWKPRKTSEEQLICHINVKRNQETGSRQTDRQTKYCNYPSCACAPSVNQCQVVSCMLVSYLVIHRLLHTQHCMLISICVNCKLMLCYPKELLLLLTRWMAP